MFCVDTVEGRIIDDAELLRLERPRDADAGGQDLRSRPVALGRRDLVDAAQDALDVHVVRLGRLDHRLVVNGEVVHDVRVARVALAVHALQAVAHDVPDLVGVRGVVVHDEGQCARRCARAPACR